MKKLYSQNFWFGVFAFLLLLFTSGCQEERIIKPTTATEAQLKEAVHQVMLEWYLWNDQVAKEVDYNAFPTAVSLLEFLKNKQYDKWSYIEDAATYFQYFDSGQYAGHGFGLSWDANNTLWVSLVYENSPAKKANLKRGDKVLKINGQDVKTIQNINEALGANTVGISNTFEVQTADGNTRTVSIAKEIIQINTVLHKEVKEVAGKKVGYLVFNSFLETSRTELKDAFTFFNQQGISDLIIDLRYNGGGRVGVASYLASIIAPNEAITKTFITYDHNKDKVAENQTITLQNPDVRTPLSRVFFITTKGSASASELLINGLKPYMNVIMVGENTYGKPVGSYAFEYKGFVIVPISLRVINAKGEADYYDGLPVNAKRADDLSLNWGNENDPSLKEILYYIQNNSFSPVLRVDTERNYKNDFLFEKGFREEIGAF